MVEFWHSFRERDSNPGKQNYRNQAGPIAGVAIRKDFGNDNEEKDPT